MGVILEPFNYLLGAVLRAIYFVVKDYGFSIILFTIFVRILILPLTLKQQKSAMEMQLIKPYMDEINKKYKDNKEKQQQEIMNLYKEHGVNPMASCLPLLIQLPILFSLYQVITKPITYILGEVAQNTQGFYGQILEAKASGKINFSFLWNFIDLSVTPHFDFNAITGSLIALFSSTNWIIPVLAAGTTYLSSKMMAAQTPSDNEQAQQMNKTMMMMMPAMTLMFSFSVPLGLGLYWLTNNLIQIAQQYVMNKHVLPKMKKGVELGNAKKNRKNGKDS